MSKKRLIKTLALAAVIIAFLFVPAFIRQPYVLHILIVMGVNIVLASSLRFIATSGQFSLGHAGMVSVGAYTSALLVMRLGMSFWLALPLAGLTAMGVAFLVGYPFARLKGIYFTMVTLFFTEVVKLTAEEWRSLTGGVAGILAIPRPNAVVIPGLVSVDFTSKEDFYYLALAMVVVTLFVLGAIESSRVGMTFLSIQQSEPLSESVGVNTAWFRVLAFGIGCFFAGLAGGFYSHYVSAIAPGSFGFLLAIYIFIYMVVGGTRKFSGPVIGAAFLTLVPELSRWAKEYEPFIFAAILLAVIFFLRGGLAGLPERAREFLGKDVGYARG
ncbi:MAG: branched-chain amino acid ABC transporter permease [Thermodesulfobacteriota bacterium]